MGKRRVGGGTPPGQKRPPLTHFLCVPLVTPTSRPQLEDSLKLFKDQVSPPTAEADQVVEKDVKDGDIVLPHVHPKAIRPVGTLHCTLGVMSLDDDKLKEAISLLQTLDIQAILKDVPASAQNVAESSSTDRDAHSGKFTSLENQTFKVDLKGLVSMHSPRSTSVLYSAPADETGRLLPFCVALQKVFKDKGFINEDRPSKLHATIVNTIYAKGRKQVPRGNAYHSRFSKAGDAGVSTQEAGSQGHGPNANAPLKIDATAILEKYEHFVWAKDVVLDRVAICEMGAKKITDDDGNVVDENYTEVASTALPS